ncbi:unnamed protein product [Heligmosomoides polygyrus]|uniref:Tail assembly chaperone n=1 Tax=Heligmosomoides polygyrus TaxID=6339 RepID=A0A183G5A3_HELPZ|nr:unnamed protein product [Heligmosomoides polygyrus]
MSYNAREGSGDDDDEDEDVVDEDVHDDSVETDEQSADMVSMKVRDVPNRLVIAPDEPSGNQLLSISRFIATLRTEAADSIRRSAGRSWP